MCAFILVTLMTGEAYENACSPSPGTPLFVSLFHLVHGLLLSYSCLQLLVFHHPGVLLSTVLKSQKIATEITLLDLSGKVHVFRFAPYATVSDLQSQINHKFKISLVLVILLWKTFTFFY